VEGDDLEEVGLDEALAGLDEDSDAGGLLPESEAEEGLEALLEGAPEAAGNTAWLDEASTQDDSEVEMPVAAETLRSGAEVDLSELVITAAQARLMAPHLAANEELTTLRLDGHELAISDLREDDELEWDSEEYTDVDAILIAEFLKNNTCVKRLDLARNQIGDAGGSALAHALASNTCIEYLNLEGNGVAQKGALRTDEHAQRAPPPLR
jgi:hypothetical protein